MRRLVLFPVLLLAVVGCDYTGDGLFSNVSDVPGVLDLGPDPVVPATIESVDDIPGAIIYGEVGATGSSLIGGVTFAFQGTGGSVCLWADPESASWNQSVARLDPVEAWTYPDNTQDDGDLDLFAGFAVYYNGSPGQEIGNFEILFEDSLGNQVPVELNECTIMSGTANTGGHSGRGAPEYCTLSATQPGVNYLVLMQTWSTPLDDDRLSYGLLVANGDCEDLQRTAGVVDECLILGESLNPACTDLDLDENGLGTGKLLGTKSDCDDSVWEKSIEFELQWCSATSGGTDLRDFCIEEAEEKDCKTEHCLCGDPDVSPTGAEVE